MTEFFSTDGPIFNFMNKVGGIILVSILWMVGCIPIITLGASTAAAYYTIVKTVRHEEGTIVKSFFESYKKNIGKGIVSSVILILFVVIYTLELMYIDDGMMEMTTIWNVTSKALIVLFAMIYSYLFPVMSRFELKLKDMWSLSFVMSVRYFYFTILLVLMPAGLFALAVLILNQFIQMLIPLIFVMPGFLLFLESFIIEKVMRKYMPPKDESIPEDEQKWYYR